MSPGKFPFISPGVVEMMWLLPEGEDAAVLFLRFDGAPSYVLTDQEWATLRDRIDLLGNQAEHRVGETVHARLDLDGGGGV